MSPRPQLWILAGGNGAGKSTFYRTRLAPHGLPFVNADIIARELFPDSPEAHSYQAAGIAEELRYGLLSERRSFCFETVFSHPGKIDFIARAKAMGYEIILVFIHLCSPSLNLARIAQRVEEGGHNVPDEKAQGRIPRLLVNIQTAIVLCDQVRALDNSRVDNPFAPVFTLRGGRLKLEQPELPHWAEYLLQASR